MKHHEIDLINKMLRRCPDVSIFDVAYLILMRQGELDQEPENEE